MSMKMKLIPVFLLLVVSLTTVNSARILAIVFTPSFSHQVAFRPIWKELAKRGHEIVLLTTDPMNETDLVNVREIDLNGSYQVMEEYGASQLLTNSAKKKGYKEVLDGYLLALSKTADWQLNHPEVQNLIKNRSEHFDLIMIEMMFPTHLAFVDRFKTPFIGICSMDAVPRVHRAIGNFMHPVVYPDYILPFGKKLSFLQRVVAVVITEIFDLYSYFTYATEDETVRKHFGENIKPLAEIEKDMSILLVNANPIFHQLRPAGPNTIRIGGGTHFKEPQPLPEDLQEFMDSAKDGVVYFSLGTNVKGALLNEEIKKNILETFSELPYKFLWKFESEDLLLKPDNVKIMKWVPQQDLFQHPNVVLFITQCGLQSMEESIFNNIPLIGIPFFGDQSRNCKIMEENGLGVVLDRKNLTKHALREAILEVTNNPTYRENVKEIASLTKDVEKTGLEKAIWWTEYAIRHKGAKHLRNPVIDMPFYKKYLLDVIGFVLLVLVSCVYIAVKIVKLVLRFVLPNRDRKKKKE